MNRNESQQEIARLKAEILGLQSQIEALKAERKRARAALRPLLAEAREAERRPLDAMIFADYWDGSLTKEQIATKHHVSVTRVHAAITRQRAARKLKLKTPPAARVVRGTEFDYEIRRAGGRSVGCSGRHPLRELSEAERNSDEAWERRWSEHDRETRALYVGSWSIRLGNGGSKRHTREFCLNHAKMWAKKHGLQMPRSRRGGP